MWGKAELLPDTCREVGQLMVNGHTNVKGCIYWKELSAMGQLCLVVSFGQNMSQLGISQVQLDSKKEKQVKFHSLQS